MQYIITILFFAVSLFSGELNWSHDYKTALKDAKAQQKLVYIFITSDTCQWCKKFEATTLQNKDILKRLYNEFIPIHLSRDRHQIPKQFKKAPVPRHYFTDAEGNILYNSLGHRGVACFDAFMDNAEDKLKISN